MEVTHISTDSAYYKPALAMALRIDGSHQPSTVDSAVSEFLSVVERSALDASQLYGSFVGEALVAVTLGLISLGRAAMMFVSSAPANDPVRRAAASATVERCCKELNSQGVVLQQALISTNDHGTTCLFRDSGFRHLTNLLYLRRSLQITNASISRAQVFEWICYSDDRRELFEEALTLSYVNSLDCPELNRLREVSDVLKTHKAVGEFQPELWWVALHESKPVGVLLLTNISRLYSTEIVYMGVSHFARGKGIANSLLDRAVSLSRQSRNTFLTAAVDERNIPARKVYERWRFVQTNIQQAWIATSFPNSR